jgi:TatD DNase family protein
MIKMIKYFDIHSHLDFPEYGLDFKAVIERMNQNEVGTITVGTDLESAKRAVALAEKYENIWACIGIHPADNHNEIWNESEFEKLVQHPKVVAIGECGLDFFRLPTNEVTGELDLEKVAVEKARQQELFEKQIQFAIKHDKTLMIHCRDVKNSNLVYEETYKTLKKYKSGELSQEKFGENESHNLRIHLHFFAGDLEVAKKFLELDATFSFTGVITFANQYDEVIKFLPLEKIMSETDAPFVAPLPYRGKRNEPAYVIEVVKKLAELKGLSVEDLSNKILENLKRVFTIDIIK